MKIMKKVFLPDNIRWLMALIATLANSLIVSGQTDTKQQSPIPENINKIFQQSCISCHGKEGGRLPKSLLNFSRWSGYDEKKQVEKASSICSSVSKGTMPPKSAREKDPEINLTKDQIELICNWSKELKLQIKSK
jgi:mono/diheme cytochrome c family protein